MNKKNSCGDTPFENHDQNNNPEHNHSHEHNHHSHEHNHGGCNSERHEHGSDCDCGCHSEDHEHGSDCDCGCNDEEFEQVVISLDGEEELTCEVVGVFESNGREYVALMSIGSDEVMLFRHSVIDGELKLGDIETDDEYDDAAEVFYELFVFDEDED